MSFINPVKISGSGSYMPIPTVNNKNFATRQRKSTRVLIYDEFTDTNGVLITAHDITPINNISASWVNFAISAYEIQSNRAIYPGASGAQINGCYIDFGAENVNIELTGRRITAFDDGAFGVVFRSIDRNNCYFVEANLNVDQFRISEIASGVKTVRAFSSVALTGNTDYTIAATISGATITATLDGANAISYNGATLNQYTKKHGFGADKASSTMAFDEIQVRSI